MKGKTPHSTPSEDTPGGTGSRGVSRKFSALPLALRAAIVIVLLEALAAAAYLVFLVIDLVLLPPNSYPGSIFLILLIAAAATWFVFIARALSRGRAWARSGAVTVQLFLIALAVGSFQGGAVAIGLAFAVPAAVVVVLLFTRPAIEATMARGEHANRLGQGR